jgi:hypothetical protein
MPNVSNLVKTIQDIMRKDAGTYGDAQRLEQLGWMFFLKIFDDREKEMELVRDTYRSPLPKALRWSTWATDAEGYNKGKPIRIEEFGGERDWWGEEKDGFKSRVENEQAWRVSIDTIKAGNFNLDLKNPQKPDDGPGDVDHLLPEYEKLLAQIAATRGQLKAQLMEALTR